MKTNRRLRAGLLKALNVEEFFVDGGISVNRRTCRGIECQLCMKACPTSALFWRAGEVGVVEELCVFCGACVLSCIVDDCIVVWRKRRTGEVERFSKSRDFAVLQQSLNVRRRREKVREVFPNAEEYLRLCRKKRKGVSRMQ